MKLTKKYQSVKLGCGMKVRARVNEYGVLNVQVPGGTFFYHYDHDQHRSRVDLVISPESIVGLEKLLRAFKSTSRKPR